MSKASDPAPPLSIEEDSRREARERLNQAAYDAKRLAAFRRTLGIMLIVVQTPVLVFGRSTEPSVKRLLLALSITWLVLVVPMLRLVFAEWHNLHLLDGLTARVRAQREPGRSSGPFRP